LSHVDSLDRVLRAVETLAGMRSTMVVPGGGPFADTVRQVDARIGLPDDTAHWMAVLAMDQYAHLLAARFGRGAVVTSLDEAHDTLNAGALPVLAPSRWLQQADPLPHSWDVTSDSIAAWAAGAAGARHLVLIKHARAAGDVVDACFSRVLPAGVTPTIVGADRAVDVLAQIAGMVKPAVDTT
jgi:aspartokinase-like uncharacterized kinase